MSFADEQGLEPEWQRALAEVERLVGGTIVGGERQERWRPAWFLDVECDGEVRQVYFRGARGAGALEFYDIEYEYRVMRVLEEHGIPVPHLYGFCEDPKGIIMDRSTGRANLGTETDPELKRTTLEHYMEILLAMHRIDVAAFEAIGISRPKTRDAVALADLDFWEKGYRDRKPGPRPLVEFALQWLRANVPTHRDTVTFCAADAGQFLFDQGRVTAVIDFELATLGDPLADLGSLRSRDISEPLGDLSHGYRHYAELSGEPLDERVLSYHSVRFALNTPLAVVPMNGYAPPGLNYAQYLGWEFVYSRLPIEIIAEVEGVELERPSLPEAPAAQLPTPHDVLVRMLEKECGGSYEVDTALRVAQYVREIDRRGARIEKEDLEEASAIVGRRLASWDEADAELEKIVAADGQARRAELLRYFHRRMLRHEALLGPAMRELENAEFQKIRL